MKKLLSVLGVISLTGSAVLISAKVVSCNATWSQEFKSILNKDAQSLTGKSYFNEGEKIVGKDSEENEVKIKSIELVPNREILDNPKDLEKIVSESLILFEQAKEYFDQFYDGTETSDYYYLLEDKGNNGDYSKLMNYESEKNFLDYFGDAITKPEFQLKAARFMVLKNNYEFNKEYELLLNKNDPNLSIEQENENNINLEDIKKMNEYIKAGYFVPMFKIMALGKVISRGSSMIKVKFDKNLVEYINVGSKGRNYLNSYVGTWFESQDPMKSSIVIYDWNVDTSTQKIAANKYFNSYPDKDPEVGGVLDRITKTSYLNGWRFAEDYKGKPISAMKPEEQLTVDKDLEKVLTMSAINTEGTEVTQTEQKIGDKTYNIISRRYAIWAFEGDLNNFEVIKIFNYGFDQQQSGGTK